MQQLLGWDDTTLEQTLGDLEQVARRANRCQCMIELPWLLYVLLGVSALGSITDAALRILRYRREKRLAEAEVKYRDSQTSVNVAVAEAMLKAVDAESGDKLMGQIERLRSQSA